MNVFGIEKAYQIKKQRGWNKLYWAIDWHDTLFKGMYDASQTFKIYPGAAEVLCRLHDQGNVLIAYTSTPEEQAMDFCRDIYKDCGINFHYINENPEYTSAGDYADFSKKFYYNVLLDDKAGFEPEKDWQLIKEELIRIGEW